MNEIDMTTWERREHFEYFRACENPQYSIGFNLDITGLDVALKKRDLSFYYAMIFFVTKSMNEIPEFRYRLRGDTVVLHDQIDPSFTEKYAEKDLFKFVSVPMVNDLLDFVLSTQEIAKKQTSLHTDDAAKVRDDFVFITSIPWISFTHLTHAIGDIRQDSVPKIGWGKFFTQGSMLQLPISLQVNHVFVDGLHIEKFKQELERLIADYVNS